jgi:hypothetical protein
MIYYIESTRDSENTRKSERRLCDILQIQRLLLAFLLDWTPGFCEGRVPPDIDLKGNGTHPGLQGWGTPCLSLYPPRGGGTGGHPTFVHGYSLYIYSEYYIFFT